MTKTENNQDEANWQNKYMEIQMLQQQMEQVNQHMEQLNMQKNEMEVSKGAIKEAAEIGEDREILAPIANGIFVKAKIHAKQNMVVNVGSNVTVEKTPEQVIKLLEEQEAKIDRSIADANEVLQELSRQMMKIYQEVEGLSVE